MGSSSKRPGLSDSSRVPVKISLTFVALILLLGPLSDNLSAAVQVQLTPSSPAPQPVGSTITWTASASDSASGPLDYQFNIQSPAGDSLMARDFSPLRMFEWTPSEREGTYRIQVIARNSVTQERAELTATYTISSLVTGESPVISSTANPLVALYSAPPCGEGSMRVRFWRTGDTATQSTPWKTCRPGVSMNFFLAGMLASAQYSVRHEISSEVESPTEIGPTLFFMTGQSKSAKGFSNLTVLVPPVNPEQGLLFHSDTFLSRAFATDLNGQLLWYYEKLADSMATRPVAGGNVLVLSNGRAGVLREIDLAGNTLRETNVSRVSEQLAARGEQGITGFHHDARRLPDGKTVVVCGVERILSGVQGPGPVDILGDMMVVLDEDWQVVWAWNSFDHLDVTRKAILDEKCGVCPPTTQSNANDWLHSNSVAYSIADGNLLLSLRHQDWVVKIDYRNGIGTGAILWRLGKDGDFTINSNDPYPWFSHQHEAEFELGGNQLLSLYDNGNTRQSVPGATHNSRGQVLSIDEQHHTATLQLNADLGVYSFAMGSAQRLANGNYHFLSGLLTNGHSQSIEVQPGGALSFKADSPTTFYRTFRMRDLYTPASFGLTSSEDDQTISFPAIGDKSFGDAPFTLSANASSGLPVSFRIMSGPANIKGNLVTIKGPGAVVVQAEQAGNANYNAAASVAQVLNKTLASIKLSNLNQTFDGTPRRVIATTDPAGLSGISITYNGSTVAPTEAGSYLVVASLRNHDYRAPDVTGTLVIEAVKALPSLSINDISLREGNSGTTNATFNVTLSIASSLPVTVNYQTLDGTALAGSDYQSAPPSALTLSPGETNRSINVAVNGDTLNEADETFFVNLSSPANASLLKAQGTATILNDDTPLVQFDNASYGISEGAGSAQITVVRAGDISQAATIDYSTADGTARQRTDYTTASGRLSFSAAEASKSFKVLLTDNAFLDGNRTVNLTLGNPVGDGLALGAQSTAVLTIRDNDIATPTTNPMDDAQSFVSQQYMDFLNREPDAGGLGFWTGEIARCGADVQCIRGRRISVADAFFFEPEFQQTGAYIYRVYKAAFGLKPTYAQFIQERGRVLAGPALDQSKSAYALYLEQSPGFQQEYGSVSTAAQFVDRMLSLVKSSSGVDLSGQRGALIGLYDGTDSGKAAILRQVAESQQFVDAEYNNSFVMMEYFGYLRRDPDDGGFNFWIGQVNKFPLRNVGIQHAMACSFITSAEYQTRFSSVVTHTNHECPQ